MKNSRFAGFFHLDGLKNLNMVPIRENTYISHQTHVNQGVGEGVSRKIQIKQIVENNFEGVFYKFQVESLMSK